MPRPKKYFNDNVKYPRLPRKYDLRYKLSKDDIVEIVKLRKKHTQQYIATKFNISTSTVQYYTNPEYRKKAMLQNAKHRHPHNNKRIRERRKIGGNKMREYLAVNLRNQQKTISKLNI